MIEEATGGEHRTAEMTKPGARVFISYAREDDDYNMRVRVLAERLRNDGVDVRLDQWHLEAGHNIVEFMSREIHDAQYVLVLCSPKFARKSFAAERGKGPSGLVWEKRFIAEMMEHSPGKVIPVLGRGAWETSAPSILRGLKYIDLSSRTASEEGYKELCRSLASTARSVRPPEPPSDPIGVADKASHAPWPPCRVIIACTGSPSCYEPILQIKRWFHRNPQFSADIGPTQFSLADAIKSASGASTVLLALGFNRQEVLAGLPEGSPRSDLEIVAQPLTIPRGRPMPSASLIGQREVVSVAGADPLPFVRKAILRLCTRRAITVRQIQTPQEFEEYFILRYKVWKEVGYLRPDDGSLEAPWEVDYTDRSSVALGAYESGRLVACVRLVYGLGEEDRTVVATIEELLKSKGGASLATRLAIPRGMRPQFDVLGAFRGFPEYYQRLVRERVAKAEVSRVIVAPEYRKHGLGEVVVDSVSALAESRRLDLLFLACRQSHRSFYERCGFNAIPDMKCDRFINRDEPSIAMERQLGAGRES